MPFLPTTCRSTAYALAPRARAMRRARFLDQVGVERAGQAAVRREQRARPRASPRAGWRSSGKPLGQLRACTRSAITSRQRLRVRARGDHAVLRALQLGRGDHLHRPRDLARVLDGLDAPLELARPLAMQLGRLNIGLNAAIAALRAPPSGRRRAPSSVADRPSPHLRELRRHVRRGSPVSHCAHRAATSTSSMKPLVTA